MKRVTSRIKPKKGYANLLHIFFSAILPLFLYVLVRLDFNQLAIATILLAKWRIFAVRPRFWPANIRANAVDIIVGISTVILMIHSAQPSLQLIWVGLYLVWQLFLKPGRSVFGVASQALVGQTYGLMALFVAFPSAPRFVFVVFGWSICYLSARHYLSSYDEPYSSLYAHVWGYFAAALMWLTSHWLIYYSFMSQPALLLTTIGFGLGGLYYLHETDRLSAFIRREVVFIMVAVVLVVLVLSDWGDKAI